jgi:hypothetical protein
MDSEELCSILEEHPDLRIMLGSYLCSIHCCLHRLYFVSNRRREDLHKLFQVPNLHLIVGKFFRWPRI